MKTYNVQQVFNQIHGLLKGYKSQPKRARHIEQIFLCENCGGGGYFKNKHDGFGTECTCCNGAGRIKLEFSVKQVELEPKFEIVKEKP